MARDVVVLVGSLRKASFNRKIAKAMRELATGSLDLEILEIGDLALYNEDLEADVPTPWLGFRDRVRKADAVLFVTPEYNRSVPGLLKNAIDVGSRPYGKSVFSGKPAAIVSVTPGALGVRRQPSPAAVVRIPRHATLQQPGPTSRTPEPVRRQRQADERNHATFPTKPGRHRRADQTLQESGIG
jgi:multimeric flavodoxin WrbA